MLSKKRNKIQVTNIGGSRVRRGCTLVDFFQLHGVFQNIGQKYNVGIPPAGNPGYATDRASHKNVKLLKMHSVAFTLNINVDICNKLIFTRILISIRFFG